MVAMSEGEDRVPPLSSDFFLQAAREAGLDDPKANIIFNSDLSPGYNNAINLNGVVQHFTVNHSLGEYARSIDIIRDVTQPDKLEPSSAGTMRRAAWLSIFAQRLMWHWLPCSRSGRPLGRCRVASMPSTTCCSGQLIQRNSLR